MNVNAPKTLEEGSKYQFWFKYNKVVSEIATILDWIQVKAWSNSILHNQITRNKLHFSYKLNFHQEKATKFHPVFN